MVALVGIVLTLRGAKDNKRDGHIAPPGHDPYGLVVMGNSMLLHLSIIAETSRRLSTRMDDLHDEQVKTNSRLAEMTDRHAIEMDRLRDTVEDAACRK